MGVQMKRTAAWFLFGVAGIYCLCVSLLGRVAFAYGFRPEAHSAVMFVRYIQPVLVLPLFLLALIPRKWTTVPLWALCISITVFLDATPDESRPETADLGRRFASDGAQLFRGM